MKNNEENEKIKNKTNINERLSTYYNRNIDKNDNYESWLKIFYWLFLSIYIIIILFIKRIYTKESLIKILVFILFPFAIKGIVSLLNFFKLTKVKIEPNINSEEDELERKELEDQ